MADELAPEIDLEDVARASAEKLSDLSNRVAAFAISSSLVLVFACLKDLGAWAKADWGWFMGGIGVSFFAYASVVEWLGRREHELLEEAFAASKRTRACKVTQDTATLLKHGRIIGIFVFSVIAALAVQGVQTEPPKTSPSNAVSSSTSISLMRSALGGAPLIPPELQRGLTRLAHFEAEMGVNDATFNNH